MKPGANREIEEWQADAACLHEDSDLFFPVKGQPTEPAKKICAVCPVCVECLDFAVRNVIDVGIWGGKSARARRTIRRRTKA